MIRYTGSQPTTIFTIFNVNIDIYKDGDSLNNDLKTNQSYRQ